MQDDIQKSIMLLRQVELFRDFDEDALTALASNMKEVHYKKDELLFVKGSPGKSMYIIVDGSVKIHNNEHTFAVLNSHQYFGEYALIDESPRSTSVTTLHGSTFLILTRERFSQVVAQRPDLWEKMMISLLGRLRNFNNREEAMTQKANEIQKEQEKLVVEKRNLEKQKNELEQKNAAKDKFFTIISHDLKNPFSAIINITDLMLSGIYQSNPHKDHEYIKQINFYSHKIFGLLENLLQWARSQTGQIKINFKSVNLNSVINSVVEQQAGVIKEKNINIDIEADPYLDIYADQDMTTFVIRNIVSNALKFSPRNSSICIKAREIEDDMVEVSIADQGPGMDEEQLAKVFRIDSRSLSHNENNELEGTGLGLILCKEFVEKNNGKIWATSTKDNGSTFLFTMPKAM